MSADNQQSGGIGCLGVLAIVFVVLKLTDNIDWSWTWVLAPLWIPIAILIPLVGFLAWAGSRR
jgi:hypothetical protein